MTQFKDREKAHENKFSRDAGFDFKVTARRNKLLGLWAAGIMGMSDDEAAAYGKEVVISDFEETGDEDVYRRVMGDFEAKRANITEHALRREMESLMITAREQLESEM
jgi:hypothetical protein